MKLIKIDPKRTLKFFYYYCSCLTCFNDQSRCLNTIASWNYQQFLAFYAYIEGTVIMTPEIMLVLSILIVAVILLITEWIPIEVTALLSLAAGYINRHSIPG
jgi:hypothetical protein